MITFFVDVTREYRKVVIERRRRLKRKKRKRKREEGEFIDPKGDATIFAMPRVARHSRQRSPWPLLYLSPENKSSRCAFCLHTKLNAIVNTYHTFASCSLWLICLSTSCFCNSAAVAAAFLWMAAAAAASLAAATRWAAATASFNDANLCCRATNCFALALASASAADEISCDLCIETTKDFELIDISFRGVSSSILVRSSSREMALRCCYSGYIAYICIYIS